MISQVQRWMVEAEMPLPSAMPARRWSWRRRVILAGPGTCPLPCCRYASRYLAPPRRNTLLLRHNLAHWTREADNSHGRS